MAHGLLVEPKVTEKLVRLMLSARGGKLQKSGQGSGTRN